MAKEKKESENIIRDSITELLEANDINPKEDIDAQTLVFQKTPSTVTNYENERLNKCKSRAEKVMTTLLRLYLSDGFISKSEYVQAKVNMDAMTLGKIMNQMEVSERAIQLLMENIEIGDLNPKLFDALGNLQRTFIDLVKTQTNYIMTAENEYEKLSMENGNTIDVSINSVEDDDKKGYKSSNQKDLMRMIRSTIEDKK